MTSREAIYVVKSGDVLGGIAQKYGVSVRSLRSWNNLKKGQYIHPGDKLIVRTSQPREPEKMVYVVKSGDVLSDIARKHGVSVKNLRSWNDLKKGQYIHPGDKLVIRTSQKQELQEELPEPEEVVYVVKPGDFLDRIARKHGVSVKNLRSWNNLKAGQYIHPGDKLVIRTSQPREPEKVVYVVKPGDFLDRIARKHGVSVKNLRSWNNLKAGQYIHPGDKLVIRTSGGELGS